MIREWSCDFFGTSERGNEGVDVHEITHRFHAQFGENAYALRTFCRQDFHDEIHTRRLLLDDLDAKILAILDKSPFESTRSIAETLGVAHSIVLLYLHDSIGLKSFHLHRMPHLLVHDLRDKRKEYAQLCCLSCMLPNEMVGIISWLVMSPDFSWIHQRVACRLCRTMTWSQSRELIFREKINV
jgi:hypothetical protein